MTPGFVIVSLGYHPDVVGGAWRVAAEQARGLAARGHAVDVVTVQASDALDLTESRDGVRIHRYPQHHGHFFANWRAENLAAAALVRECLSAASRPTLVIQHHAYLEPAVATIPAPILHVFHGPWAEEYRFAKRGLARGWLRRQFDGVVAGTLHRVEHRALRRADRIVVLSRHFSRELARWHGKRIRQAEVVPGGVDFTRFQPAVDRAAVRSTCKIGADEFLFLALRRLDPRMGLNLLVEAFAGVAVDFPSARLWLTGRGPAEAGLREQIRVLGLEKSVRLLGFVDEAEVPALLNAADAAVMPSLDLEGFGLATAEALACGTPVLGSRAGATPELLEPLAASLLFEPASVPALVSRLREALRNPGGLPSRAACAAYAREHFSWDAQVAACQRAAVELPARPPAA